MSERQLPNPERDLYGAECSFTPEDYKFLHVMLGMPNRDEPFCDLNDTDPVYSEPREIWRNVLAVREKMRAQLMDLAQIVHGLSDQEAAEIGPLWSPSDAEIQALLATPEIRKERRSATMIEGIETFLADYEAVAAEMGVPLRPHQVAGVEKIYNHMLYWRREKSGHGGKRGVIESATGTGKSAIMAKTAAALKHYEDSEDPINIVIVTPRNTLVEQMAESLRRFAPHLDVGIYNKDEKNETATVRIITDASLRNLSKEGQAPVCDAVFVDEVHTAMGEVTAPVVDEFCQGKLAFGFSATAGDPDDEKNKVYATFEHQIYSTPLREAVKDGLLAPVTGKVLDAEPKFAYRDVVPADPIERRRYMREARLKARQEASVPIIKRAIDNGKGVVVRCPAGRDIKIASDYAQVLRDKLVKTSDTAFSMRYVLAAAVGGSTARQSDEERRLILEGFNRGDVDVLTHVRALGLGWHSSHARVFIDLTDPSSYDDLTQAMGRVTSLSWDSEGNPVRAEVYSFRNPDNPGHLTVLDVLGTEDGETLNHEPQAREAPLPVPRTRRRKPLVEVAGATVVTVDETSLENETPPQKPSDPEIAKLLDRYSEAHELSYEEFCRVMGVSALTGRTILSQFGSVPGNVSIRDMRAILDTVEYSHLQVEPLPEDSTYISDVDLTWHMAGVVRRFTIHHLAGRLDIRARRFRKPDGRIGFYFTQEEAGRLQEYFSRSVNDPYPGRA